MCACVCVCVCVCVGVGVNSTPVWQGHAARLGRASRSFASTLLLDSSSNAFLLQDLCEITESGAKAGRAKDGEADSDRDPIVIDPHRYFAVGEVIVEVRMA